MNWNKANRILDGVICIVLIVLLPMWALRILGIERMYREGRWNRWVD